VNRFRPVLCILVTTLLSNPPWGFGASHREAPITALDTKADITDFYAFVSYDNPTKVTMILDVDPLLAPGNGPNYFPFDDNILYAIRIDNNNDALEDISFQFRFQTEIRAPEVFTGFVGAGDGINAPSNSPPPVAPGTPIVPPAITSLDGPGSAGLSLRQTYTVTMVKHGVSTPLANEAGGQLFAVPTNVGPRTMPEYTTLAKQGIYGLGNGIRVFAGTVDDPFYIDLGATFDSLNLRKGTSRSIGGVLTAAQDADDNTNTAPDFVSGFNVNTIAIEVPIAMLTRTGTRVAASNPAATIGVWGTTSRPQITVRRSPNPTETSGLWSQVQRMGNPLINELIIGTGDKDFWSMSQPKDDSQFAHYALDPLLTRVVNAVYGINVPAPPRNDLLLLMEYLPPIAASGTPKGPVADLLRLNTGIPPTPQGSRRRLAVLAGDFAGFPNGRRVSDDVTDIALRVVAGGVLVSGFNVSPNDRLGDGVNTNDLPYQETFPYVAFAHDGRDSRHIDPGEPGCTMGAGAPCPIN
jgi:hypothetical protein